MVLWKILFSLSGWKIKCNVELPNKCVICVAPHTSNLDFILGLLAYRSIGRKANFLMKKFWFFFPLGILLRSLGGIPVDRKKNKKAKCSKNSLVESIVERFRESQYLNLAVTPEGTRSANPDWKTGFIAIAMGAKVPILLAGLDFSTKSINFDKIFYPTADIDKDLKDIKAYYSDKKLWARYPDKFKL